MRADKRGQVCVGGRVSRPSTPLNDRKYKLCNINAVEDEVHFAVSCDFYTDLRYNL